MEGSDDPYELLGVSPTANAQEIRSAYRKLALKHHPDRKNTDEERAVATVTFAKIANAYELLSDEEKRQQFDQQKQQQQHSQQQRRSSSRNAHHMHQSAFGAGGLFDDFFQHHHAGFHDPFQVFERVFREEFGGGSRRDHSNRHSSNVRQQQQQFHGDVFGDSPFMHDPFFQQREHRGGMIDPFFGGGLMRGSIFGRGGSGRDPFDDMFTSMRRQMEQHTDGMNNHRGSGNRNSYSYSSTSSSSFGGFGGGGESVSTTTTTRMINGKQETVTERVVRKADGTVERTINTNNEDGFDARDAHRRALQGNGLFGLPPGYAENDQSQEPEVQEVAPPRGYLPWSGRRNSRREKKQDDEGDDRPTKSRKRT